MPGLMVLWAASPRRMRRQRLCFENDGQEGASAKRPQDYQSSGVIYLGKQLRGQISAVGFTFFLRSRYQSCRFFVRDRQSDVE
jgi:hypothetical protein